MYVLNLATVYCGRFANGGENKFFDTARASVAIGTGGTITNLSLNLIPQGVTESTRVGRKCTIKGLFIKGQLFLNEVTDGSSSADVARVIIYHDKQANGTTAAVLDILETATLNSFRNLSNSNRFRILHDKTMNLAIPSAAGNGTTQEWGRVMKNFKINKKLSMPIEFSATTGAITEIRSNNIGVLMISSAGFATVLYTARVRFSDA